MKTIHSLRTVSGLNPEMEASDWLSPFEIAACLEENFNRQITDDETIAPGEYRNGLLKLATALIHKDVPKDPEVLIVRSFGKWKPNGADKILQTTRQYLIQHANERGYPIDAADEIGSTVWSCQRIKELEKFKQEQKTIRRAQRHFIRQETGKQTVDGKRQWNDAQVFELPPLVKAEGSGVEHQPARYAILLPDKTVIDLGRTQEHWAPVKRGNPMLAFHGFATRHSKKFRKNLAVQLRNSPKEQRASKLKEAWHTSPNILKKKERKGGDVSLLNELLGHKPTLDPDTGSLEYAYLPAYTTVWQRNEWLVLVGWQKNPKLTPSSYSLGVDGELTRAESPDGFLSLSELDYHLLKGAAETEIEDATGDVVDYMNEDEELVMQGFMRDETDEPEPMDSFLLVQAAANMGLSVELRNGSAIWNHPELRDQLAVMLRESVAERHQLNGSIRRVKSFIDDIMARIFHGNPSPLEKEALKADLKSHYKHMGRLKNRRTALLVNFRNQMEDLESQSELVEGDGLVRYWVPNHERGFGSMKGTESNPPAMEPVRTEPFMALSPANSVQLRNVVVETETMPDHRTSAYRCVKRGTVAVTGFDLGLGLPVKKAIPKLPQAPLTARNASPKLKEKLRTIIREELETGTLEQEVADTFAETLRQCLGSI